MIQSFSRHVWFWSFVLCNGCRADGLLDNPSIKVTPSQIQLGSLEFDPSDNAIFHTQLVIAGMAPETRIIDIDCSHAQGVRVVSQSKDAQGTKVELDVNEKLLCEAEPFGAFIKREIRLETNSAIQHQFVIPVIGWMDINKTRRDFSQFVFHGATRWQGIWSTPNEAGALLMVLVLPFCGIIGWLWRIFVENRGWAAGTGFCIAVSAVGVALVFLGLTYSRGAWLATFTGYAAIALICPPLRRIAQVVMMAFMGVLLVLPFGIQRVESYTVLQDDLSIANRLKLWEGALQMMAEHPFTGVGLGKFESTFEQDYQTFDHTAKTSTAVSDYLTLGSEHGLVALGLALGSFLSILTLALRLSIKTQGITISTLAGTLIAILIASCFSTLWIVPEYQLLAAAVILASVGYIVSVGKREVGLSSFGRSLLKSTSRWTGGSLAILVLASMASLAFLPTRSFTMGPRLSDHAMVSYRVVEPRWTASRGIILYLGDSNHPDVLFHSAIRPLAAMGWKVIAVPESADPDTLRSLLDFLHRDFPQLNLFVAGDSRGGRAAWKIAAQESPDLVKAGGGIDFLSMDMDVSGKLNEPHQPFLVYQSLYSDGTSSNPAICAQKQKAFKGLPLTIVLSQDEINHFSAGWMKFLVTLSEFFLYENRHDE